MRHGNSGNGHGTSGSPQTSIDNSVSSNKNDGERKLNKMKQINKQKQNKHIFGTKEFQNGKSEITISLFECQNLINKFSGRDQQLPSGRERVDFGKVIGYYVDENTGKKYQTTVGIIHYSKTGAHIVPATPKGGINDD